MANEITSTQPAQAAPQAPKETRKELQEKITSLQRRQTAWNILNKGLGILHTADKVVLGADIAAGAVVAAVVAAPIVAAAGSTVAAAASSVPLESAAAAGLAVVAGTALTGCPSTQNPFVPNTPQDSTLLGFETYDGIFRPYHYPLVLQDITVDNFAKPEQILDKSSDASGLSQYYTIALPDNNGNTKKYHLCIAKVLEGAGQDPKQMVDVKGMDIAVLNRADDSVLNPAKAKATNMFPSVWVNFGAANSDSGRDSSPLSYFTGAGAGNFYQTGLMLQSSKYSNTDQWAIHAYADRDILTNTEGKYDGRVLNPNKTSLTMATWIDETTYPGTRPLPMYLKKEPFDGRSFLDNSIVPTQADIYPLMNELQKTGYMDKNGIVQQKFLDLASADALAADLPSYSRDTVQAVFDTIKTYLAAPANGFNTLAIIKNDNGSTADAFSRHVGEYLSGLGTASLPEGSDSLQDAYTTDTCLPNIVLNNECITPANQILVNPDRADGRYNGFRLPRLSNSGLIAVSLAGNNSDQTIYSNTQFCVQIPNDPASSPSAGDYTQADIRFHQSIYQNGNVTKSAILPTMPYGYPSSDQEIGSASFGTVTVENGQDQQTK